MQVLKKRRTDEYSPNKPRKSEFKRPNPAVFVNKSLITQNKTIIHSRPQSVESMNSSPEKIDFWERPPETSREDEWYNPDTVREENKTFVPRLTVIYQKRNLSQIQMDFSDTNQISQLQTDLNLQGRRNVIIKKQDSQNHSPRKRYFGSLKNNINNRMDIIHTEQFGFRSETIQDYLGANKIERVQFNNEFEVLEAKRIIGYLLKLSDKTYF